MVTSTKPATTGRGEARRAAILAAAGKLFADRPYDLLSIDDIARDSQSAKGLIYYYFGSKRGLFLAVMENAANTLTRLAEESGGQSPVDRLISSLEAFLWYAETHRAAFRTMISGGVGVDPEVCAFYLDARKRILTAMSQGLVGAEQARPTLRIALEGWMSFVEGATVAWLQTRDMPREQLRDLAVRVLGGTLQAVGVTDPDADQPAEAKPV